MATFNGTKHSETINGTGGDDRIFGENGNDSLNGGAGNDILIGGAGADELTGGAGKDWFRYTSVSESSAAGGIDRIIDFGGAATGERLDLSAIDANSNAGAAGDQAFTFIGVDAIFTGTAGELRVVNNNGNWFVEGDVDGDGSADLVIQVMNGGSIAWSGSDFIY